MVELVNQKALRSVRNLPFCYLCGRDFHPGEDLNHDHVPPKTIFAVADRQPLMLQTHVLCNSRQSLIDEKIGQLISLQRGEAPDQPENRKLQLRHLGVGLGAVMNLDIDSAIVTAHPSL